jgi:hypothetical protein
MSDDIEWRLGILLVNVAWKLSGNIGSMLRCDNDNIPGISHF